MRLCCRLLRSDGFFNERIGRATYPFDLEPANIAGSHLAGLASRTPTPVAAMLRPERRSRVGHAETFDRSGRRHAAEERGEARPFMLSSFRMRPKALYLFLLRSFQLTLTYINSFIDRSH